MKYDRLQHNLLILDKILDKASALAIITLREQGNRASKDAVCRALSSEIMALRDQLKVK